MNANHILNNHGQGEQLPVGTYFYVIEYKTAEGVSKNRVGYIYLNR